MKENKKRLIEVIREDEMRGSDERKKKSYVYVLIGPLLGKIIGNAQDAPLEIKCRDGRSQQAYQLKPLHRVDPQARPRTPKYVSSRKSWPQKNMSRARW